jgi:Na+/H+ antiporter NhaC
VPRVSKTLLLKSVAVAVFLAICLSAYLATGPRGAGDGLAGHRPKVAPDSGAPPWYSIVPPLLAVTLALVTNRIFPSLGAAVFVGGLLSLDVTGGPAGAFPRLAQGTGGMFLYRSVAGLDNLQILLFVVLIMAMISVMLASGGLQGVAAWLMKYARSARSAKLVTMAAGLIIFIDDYANTMIVGPALRPLTDRQRVSREKLAFLVDATAAPVAGIALISTWIGVEVGFLARPAADFHVAGGGYAMFFDALGFRFYCILMIAFVFFNALSGQDFGPMAKAEERAGKHGKLFDDGARLMTSQSLAAGQPHPSANIHAMVAIVPMVALLVVFVGRLWFDAGGLAKPISALLHFSVWKEVLRGRNSIPLLAHAAGVGLLVALLLAQLVARIPVSAMARAIGTGLGSSLLPLGVLVLAWSLKEACYDLHTREFLAHVLAGAIPPRLFPALVFVVAALTSFATGTSWGTMAILIPTAVPVAFQLDGREYGLITMVSVAAVLDGSIFGDHCSPISDTTIMSSAASACDHLAHVRTQLPYSLAVAGLALFAGYLPAGLGAPKWTSILAGAAISGLLFVGLHFYRTRRMH